MLTEVLSILLLLAFLGVNLTVTGLRIGGRLAGITLKRLMKVEVPRNEKKGIERLFTPLWILIGLWGAWQVRWSVLAMLFAFLAFRSGANVSRILVYSIHDSRIIERYTSEGRILKLLGKAVKWSLTLEGTFILAFALAYKAISVTTGPTGSSRGGLILWLWLSGLLFGLLFGWFIARNNDGILLENEIAIVSFFAGKKGQEKTKGAISRLSDQASRLRK
jgi:hypothetical protein